MNRLLLAVCLAGLCLLAAARQPTAPRRGSYTYNVLVDGGQTFFLGGRVYFDYVAGYVRKDNWNSNKPNPGINGISLWDLRSLPPRAYHIERGLTCDVYKLDPAVDPIPTPDDYSSYKFMQTGYYNRAFSEKWADQDGNYIWINAFSRDLVGMGTGRNASDPESQALEYIITEWSDKQPDGTLFILPGVLTCIERNSTTSVNTFGVRGNLHKQKREAQIDKRVCNGCKDSMKKKIFDMCQRGKTPEQVCREQNKGVVTPQCVDGIINSCQPGALTPDGMCKFMRLC